MVDEVEPERLSRKFQSYVQKRTSDPALTFMYHAGLIIIVAKQETSQLPMEKLVIAWQVKRYTILFDQRICLLSQRDFLNNLNTTKASRAKHLFKLFKHDGVVAIPSIELLHAFDIPP